MLETAGAFANIPAKANRKRSVPFSTFLYRYRNLVERFFGKLKFCKLTLSIGSIQVLDEGGLPAASMSCC
jgi:hypothetical protein